MTCCAQRSRPKRGGSSSTRATACARHSHRPAPPSTRRSRRNDRLHCRSEWGSRPETPSNEATTTSARRQTVRLASWRPVMAVKSWLRGPPLRWSTTSTSSTWVHAVCAACRCHSGFFRCEPRGCGSSSRPCGRWTRDRATFRLRDELSWSRVAGRGGTRVAVLASSGDAGRRRRCREDQPRPARRGRGIGRVPRRRVVDRVGADPRRRGRGRGRRGGLRGRAAGGSQLAGRSHRVTSRPTAAPGAGQLRACARRGGTSGRTAPCAVSRCHRSRDESGIAGCRRRMGVARAVARCGSGLDSVRVVR